MQIRTGRKRRQILNKGWAGFAGLLLVLSLSCGQEEEPLPDKVTYTEHVAPLLFQHCTVCHRPGEGAHFDLVNYEQARRYGSAMAFMVKERRMPPWPADPLYRSFVGQRVLTEREIALIDQWVKTGMERGPEEAMPEMPDYPQGSQLGTPDLRIPLEPIYLPANSPDQFYIMKVPFELPRDTFARVIEFVAGNRRVVHHVNGDMVRYAPGAKADVFEGERVVDMRNDSTVTQAYEALGLANDDGSYPLLQRSVVNYLPGVTGQWYPEGIGGYLLPQKGAFLLNDIHYGFTGSEAQWDSSYINIFYAKEPPRRPVREFQLGTLGVSEVEPDLIIPPDTEKKVMSRFQVPETISLLTINPHMHLLGKSFKAYALPPNGDTIRLISIPRWDFNWQYFYTFEKMVKIPAGSWIIAEGVYDNTRRNPHNPFVPPREVRDREGSMKSTDEMFQFIITYLPYEPGDEDISLGKPLP